MSSRPWTVAERLAAARASPAAVAVHDRAAWVGLFAADGQVNDPVGSRPHEGRAAIERFYDSFIAPNRIAFDVDHDLVCGMSVIRDLTIATTMASGVTLRVPMHLRYDLVDEAGALKIRRLYAHWELAPMIRQLLGRGRQGLAAALQLGPQMLRHQGLAGALGFARGFAGVGAAGKRRAQTFLDACGRGDAAAAQAQLAPSATLEWPCGQRSAADPFFTRALGLRASKLLAAGRSVTATLRLAGGARGLALLHFNAADARISGVHIFIQGA